jgi:hypothetical protein
MVTSWATYLLWWFSSSWTYVDVFERLKVPKSIVFLTTFSLALSVFLYYLHFEKPASVAQLRPTAEHVA